MTDLLHISDSFALSTPEHHGVIVGGVLERGVVENGLLREGASVCVVSTRGEQYARVLGVERLRASSWSTGPRLHMILLGAPCPNLASILRGDVLRTVAQHASIARMMARLEEAPEVFLHETTQRDTHDTHHRALCARCASGIPNTDEARAVLEHHAAHHADETTRALASAWLRAGDDLEEERR